MGIILIAQSFAYYLIKIFYEVIWSYRVYWVPYNYSNQLFVEMVFSLEIDNMLKEDMF